MTCPGVIQNGGVPNAPVLLFLPPEGAFSPFQNNPEETREIWRKTDKTKNSFGFPGFLPETLDKTGKYSVSSSGQPRMIPVCGLTPKNPARRLPSPRQMWAKFLWYNLWIPGSLPGAALFLHLSANLEKIAARQCPGLEGVGRSSSCIHSKESKDSHPLRGMGTKLYRVWGNLFSPHPWTPGTPAYYPQRGIYL